MEAAKCAPRALVGRFRRRHLRAEDPLHTAHLDFLSRRLRRQVVVEQARFGFRDVSLREAACVPLGLKPAVPWLTVAPVVMGPTVWTFEFTSGSAKADTPPTVAAGRSAERLDRIAELTQPLDVAPDCAAGDLEAVGELGAGPVAARLEQREQLEKSARRGGHNYFIVADN